MTIDIRNLKFNETARVHPTLYVTRILGGYIYETILEGDNMASVALVFVPLDAVDNSVTDRNIPNVDKS